MRLLDVCMTVAQRTWVRAAVAVGGSASRHASDLMVPSDKTSYITLYRATGRPVSDRGVHLRLGSQLSLSRLARPLVADHQKLLSLPLGATYLGGD
jgi:hypothetical protein